MDITFSFLISFFFTFTYPAIIPYIFAEKRSTIDQRKPNILIILADDMGYSEIGSYEGISRTPNLDKLAKEGIRFTNFYAGAPNCSPSRSALLTGKSPAITGIYNYRPPQHPMHLRAEEKTLAGMLKEQEYQTSVFGKWHLGCLPQDESLNQPQPDDHGFDYYFATENNAEPSHHNPENFVRNGRRVGKLNGYSCQLVADEAISWIDNHYQQEDPFLMYIAFHEPHASTQWTAPPHFLQNYKDYPEREANCFANVQNLDSAAGRILKHLAEKNLINNTIVIFSSDNGSYRPEANGGFKAVKSYLYEGGIRVPGIVWKSELGSMAGSIIHEPAGLIDIVPTVRDILNIKMGQNLQLDGTSILSLIEGEPFERHQPLFWFFYRTSPEIAMRAGNYMIMGKDEDLVPRTHQFSARDMDYIKSMQIKKYELYDLEKDFKQTLNMIDENEHSESFKNILSKKLEDIQRRGYQWNTLPELPDKQRKLKTDWVKLK